MRKWAVLSSTFFLLAGISGCASDQRDSLITGTIQETDRAATTLGSIKSALNEALKKADKEKRPLAAKDLEEAVKQTDTLKTIGREMQKIKQKTDSLKEALTKEDQEKLLDRYKDKVTPAVTRLQEEQQELNKVLAKVKQAEAQKDALEPFLRGFKEAQGEFAVLAKQR
jgi:hypothetical protein